MSEYREARASVADKLNMIEERTENRSLIKRTLRNSFTPGATPDLAFPCG
jgi:hypothetical protein